jgi:general stress protein YciG
MELRASKDLNKPITVQEAGRRGGQATLQNQGRNYFQKIGRKGGKRTAELYQELLREFGKKGGRPHRPVLNELMGEQDRQ